MLIRSTALLIASVADDNILSPEIYCNTSPFGNVCTILQFSIYAVTNRDIVFYPYILYVHTCVFLDTSGEAYR